MKTQSCVVSTSNMPKGYQTNRNQQPSITREGSEHRHMKSIIIEPKRIRDSSNDFNPNHHRSVVVFNHSRAFSNAEAIGPQKSKMQAQLDQKN